MGCVISRPFLRCDPHFRQYWIIFQEQMFKLFFHRREGFGIGWGTLAQPRGCFYSKAPTQGSSVRAGLAFLANSGLDGTIPLGLSFPGGRLLWLLLLVLCGSGCATIPPLPPANLKDQVWKVREGQAVWKAKRDAPEIAGEILVATRPDGRAFVQFTKTPFPFVIAQATTNSWQIESPTQNRRYSGPGRAPARLIWLQLPAALTGRPPPKPWSWRRLENNGWLLENGKSGESLEGYFTQ